jgi:hypothetical protein
VKVQQHSHVRGGVWTAYARPGFIRLEASAPGARDDDTGRGEQRGQAEEPCAEGGGGGEGADDSDWTPVCRRSFGRRQ